MLGKMARSALPPPFGLPELPVKRARMESDPTSADRLGPALGETCQVAGKRPHIIMVHDESSFDITAPPGVKVAPSYRRHFANRTICLRIRLVGLAKAMTRAKSKALSVTRGATLVPSHAVGRDRPCGLRFRNI
jgi:hypothetical protein